MNMRPLDENLLNHCANTTRCTNCAMRIGCPIRKDFYKDTERKEILIQVLELKFQKLVGEEIAYLASSDVRNKILTEIGEYPGGYSYI